MDVSQGKAKDIREALPDCPICYEVFTDPRMLTICGHTFCNSCLEAHVRKGSPQAKVVWCPVCREQMPLPQGGVDSLPKNYSVQSMIDKIQDMSVAAAAQPDPEAGAAAQLAPIQEKYTAKCKKHSTEVANFCCETCKGALICRDCTVLDHKDHHYINVTDKSEQCIGCLSGLLSQHQKMTSEIIAVDRGQEVDTIRQNTQRMESEIKELAAKNIREIKAAEEKSLARARDIGQALEERTDLMFYNENPIDYIVEMVHRGNEYEISEKFDEAREKLHQSLSEMRQKMSFKGMSTVAKCLSFRHASSGQEKELSSLIISNLVITDLCWKSSFTQTDISPGLDVVSFTSNPYGSWFVLVRLVPRARSFHHFMVVEILPGGRQGKSWTLNGKAVDLVCRKDGTIVVFRLIEEHYYMTGISHYLSSAVQSNCALPIKPLSNGKTVLTCMDSQDHVCIPETNGYNIWKVSTTDGQSQEFSVNGFSKPTSAICSGEKLFFINSNKKITERKMTPGSSGIPTPWNSDPKLGDPMQVLVDPRTEEILVVYQSTSDDGKSELCIHQLGSSRGLVEPIKLNFVPKVIKADINSHSGNLSILVVNGQAKKILHYEHENLPTLSGIPGILQAD